MVYVLTKTAVTMVKKAFVVCMNVDRKVTSIRYTIYIYLASHLI